MTFAKTKVVVLPDCAQHQPVFRLLEPVAPERLGGPRVICNCRRDFAVFGSRITKPSAVRCIDPRTFTSRRSKSTSFQRNASSSPSRAFRKLKRNRTKLYRGFDPRRPPQLT